MPSFDPNNKNLPTGTVKQPALFSNREIDVPAPINPERQRIGQTDTEIVQNNLKDVNFFNPLSILKGMQAMAKDKEKQVQNTDSILSNVRGFINDTNAINRRMGQTIAKDATESAKRANEMLAASKAQKEQSVQTPRKSVEERIKEIEAKNAAMTPEERTKNLLASVERGQQEYESSKEKTKKLTDELDARSAERLRRGETNFDPDTIRSEVQRLNKKGVYVSDAGKEHAQARQELGIVAVDQGSFGPSRLQDLNRSGTPRLMTGQEVAQAGERFDKFFAKSKEITNRTNDRTIDYFKKYNPSMLKKLPNTFANSSPSTAPTKPQSTSPLVRESVEHYKEKLNEGAGSALKRVGKGVLDWSTRPGGFVGKVVDPIVSGVGWLGRKLGLMNRTTAKGLVRGRQAARAAVRVGVPAVIAGRIASNWWNGPKQYDYGESGIESGGRFNPNSGMSGVSGTKRKKEYEVNYDVSDALASGDEEPRLRQIAAMQDRGESPSYISRTIARQRTLAHGIAKARGDKEAMKRLRQGLSPGAWSGGDPVIQPVERRGGEATRKYGEMMREPGGVVGATRRKEAERILSQDIAKNPQNVAATETANMREKVKADTARVEAELRKQMNAPKQRSSAYTAGGSPI